MTDLQSKYQKLASEYAKLRAQVPVLKEAVFEEKSKQSDLQDNLKTKDQSIRKLEQEVDSLIFRNQQLTARVELFQRESDTSNQKVKKNKKGASAQAVDPSHQAASAVLSEELQSKITENAALHTRLSETEVRHSAQVEELRRQIAQLKVAASEHESEIKEKHSSNEQLLQRLQDDKIKLEVKLQRRDTEYREVSSKAQTLEERLTNVESKLSEELANAKRIIKEKLQFNDSELSSLNSLNMAAFDRSQQARCKELVGQAAGMVRDMVQGLLNFYTYSEQRAQVYPVDSTQHPLSAASKQYCQHLHENAAHIRPVEQAFKAFNESISEETITTLETAVGLQKFAVAFEKLSGYVSKVLPYQLLCLEEECNAPLCTSQLQSSNRQLATAYKHWQAAIAKISTYVSLLAHQSSPNCDHPRSSQARLLSLTSEAITHAHHILQGMSRCYQMKLTLEHELPTVSEKLKVTNECTLSALLTLVNVFNKASAFFMNNMTVLSKSTHSAVDVRSHPVTSQLRQRAASYMSSLQRPSPDSVPHQTALHNRKTLYSSTESRDSLSLQVVSLQERVTKLEQEKEHWMLETKLLQRKYEKECQKSREAEQRVKTLSDSTIAGPGTSPAIGAAVRETSEHPEPGGPELNTLLGRLTRTLSEDNDIDSREEFIKTYYSNKIADVTKQIQLADSKAINFQAECRALSKQLTSSVKDRDKIKEELDATRETVVQLKDDLQTTTRNYEDQLKTMTEHLTGMNDKLTSQTDEIDALKHKLTSSSNNKVFKKGFLGKPK